MQLTLLVVLTFASYRIVRFIIEDTLVEGLREAFFTRLLQLTRSEYTLYRKGLFGPEGRSWWRTSIATLLDCPYCLGIWVSAGVVAITDHYVDVPLPGLTWLAVSGAMMVPWRYLER